eukprot:198984_1
MSTKQSEKKSTQKKKHRRYNSVNHNRQNSNPVFIRLKKKIHKLTAQNEECQKMINELLANQADNQQKELYVQRITSLTTEIASITQSKQTQQKIIHQLRNKLARYENDMKQTRQKCKSM